MNSLLTLVQGVGLGAAFVVALFYFGFGATRWLLPPPFERWRALIIPFVGLTLVVVWDYLALYFGINLTLATIALIVAATVTNGLALWELRATTLATSVRATTLGTYVRATTSPPWRPALRGLCGYIPMGRIHRESRQRPDFRRSAAGQGAAPTILPRVHLLLIGIALITFLAAIAPMLRYGYVTIIGENWDYEFYLPLADALRSLPTSTLAQAPANPLMNVVLSRHIFPLPMGFSYLQSTLDVLFRLDALDSFAILLAVVRALGVVSSFIFFRATLKMSNRAALTASALLAFNSLLLWTTYWNYGLQLTSLAPLPLAIAFGADALMRRSSGEHTQGDHTGSPLRSSSLPIAALFLAALNVTFHPTLIAALLTLGVLGVYLLVSRHRKRWRVIALGAALLVLTAALSFPTLFHIEDFRREYYGREPLATGLRDFIPLGDAYGLSLYSLDLVVGHTIPTPVLYDLAVRIWEVAGLIFLLLAVAASLFALWQLRHDSERRAIWYIVVGTSVFYVAVFRLPFLRPYPYGFLKSLTLVSFVLIGLVVKGISDLSQTEFGRFLPKEVREVSDFTSHDSRFTRFALRTAYYATRVGFAALTLFTFAISLEQYFKPAPAFFNADDLRLRAVPQVLRRGSQVFLTDRGEVQKIPMGFAAYALRDFDLRGDVATGYGQMNNATTGAVYDYALLARGEDPLARGYQAAPLWTNQKFALYEKAPGVVYHRNLDARVGAPNVLTFSISADSIIAGSKTVSTTIATRGVSVALASFVPQTATLALGSTTQNVTLTPGLTIYDFQPQQLPTTLTVTTSVARKFIDAATVRFPHELPRADIALFVPWIELRAGDGAESQRVTTNSTLVRCSSANAGGLNAKCFVANPSGSTLRWEYVVRGSLKGTHEDQEFIRRGTLASPRASLEIGADAPDGLSRLQFDELLPLTFAPQNLTDGNYRAALEIFAPQNESILLARLDLYTFRIDFSGSSLTRDSPPDSPLVIVQP